MGNVGRTLYRREGVRFYPSIFIPLRSFFTLFASSFGSVSPFQLLSISPGLPPCQICASLLSADGEEEEEEGGG